MDILDPHGKFAVECFYRRKLVDFIACNNDTTNEGENRFLNVGFHSYLPTTSWWIGIIDNTNYSALAATDTYPNIGTAGNGWQEFTSYLDVNNTNDASTRPAWTTDEPSNGSITNATYRALYNMTAAGTIRGLFIAGGSPSAQLKGDHSFNNSVLWATALFPLAKTVAIGTLVRVLYTVNA
jgi:hypothetical protein